MISKWDNRANPSNYPYSIRCVNGFVQGMKYAKNIGFPKVKSVSLVDDSTYHSVIFLSVLLIIIYIEYVFMNK